MSRRRTRVLSNTDTYNYTKLWNFLKLLAMWHVSIYIVSGIHVCIRASYPTSIYRRISVEKLMAYNYRCCFKYYLYELSFHHVCSITCHFFFNGIFEEFSYFDFKYPLANNHLIIHILTNLLFLCASCFMHLIITYQPMCFC